MDSIWSMGRWIVALLKKMGRVKVRDGGLVLARRGKEEVKDGMSLNWVIWVDSVTSGYR
jgi:hypothetical protein